MGQTNPADSGQNSIHAHANQRVHAIMEDFDSLHRFFILYENDEIGVQDIVNQRAHLVADSLDAMLAAASIGQG